MYYVYIFVYTSLKCNVIILNYVIVVITQQDCMMDTAGPPGTPNFLGRTLLVMWLCNSKWTCMMTKYQVCFHVSKLSTWFALQQN